MAFVSKWFGFGHDAAFDDGVRAFERGEFEEAAGFFRSSAMGAADRSIRDRAKSYLAGSLGRLARRMFEARDFDSAHRLAAEATETRPGFADLWLLRSRIEKALGRWDEARQSVEQALSINPEYGAALVLRGVILMHAAEPQLGFLSVEEGVRIDHRLAGKEWVDGERAFREGDYAAAESAFAQIEPRGSDIHQLLSEGDALAKKGDWQAAAELFQAVSWIAPSYADVHIRFGQAQLELDNLDGAKKAFQTAIAANPDYAEAYALMGVASRRMGDEEAAMSAFRRTLEIDPQHPIASQEVLYRRKV